VLGVIHYNPSLSHQRDHARAFAACGFQATTDKAAPADVHVVSGPHYALTHWLHHPNVLVIDRAWWGDPDCVSIGWLKPDGSRRFAVGDSPRPHPEPMPWKQREQSALLLVDYKQPITTLLPRVKSRFHYVRVRRHPAEVKPPEDLSAAIALCDVAVGTSGTALFDCIMAGLPSVCLDDNNPLAEVCAGSLDEDLIRPDRSDWLHRLSYAQFTLGEIADGTAWRLLKDVQDI
jgi:hypothetical protein